jgi:peptide/nickel transport system substrate-binding protein
MRKIRYVVFLGIVLFISNAWGQEPKVVLNYPERILRLNMMDPIYGSRYFEVLRLQEMIYSYLWKTPVDFQNPVSDLAKVVPERPSEDNLKIIIELDPSAGWPDGKPVSSEDIIESIQRYQTQDSDLKGKHILTDLIIQPMSEREISISHKGNDLTALLQFHIFLVPEMKIMPAHLIQAGIGPKTKYSKRPIGSGPFQIESISRTNRLTLRRNQKSHLSGSHNPGAITEVNVNEIPDFGDIHSGLIASQYDLIIEEIQNKYAIDLLKNPPQISRTEQPENSWWAIVLNHQKPALADPAFRRLLDAMIDNQSLVTNNFPDEAASITGPFIPGYGRGKTDLTDRTASLDEIKAELQSLGYSYNSSRQLLLNGNTVSFRLIYNLNIVPLGSRELDMLDRIVNILKQNGIKVNINPLNQTSFDNRYKVGDFDMALNKFTFRLMASAAIELFSEEQFGYNSEILKQKLNQSKTNNNAERIKAEEAIHQQIYDEVPWLFLLHVKRY